MTIENNRITDPTSLANKKTNEELGVPAQPVGMRPLVPPSLVPVAGVVAAVLGVIGMLPVVPPPFNALAQILAFVAAALAGLASKQPALAEAKPVVPLIAAPTLGSTAVVLQQVGASLPQDGWGSKGLTVAALLAAWLAGKALPAPTK